MGARRSSWIDMRDSGMSSNVSWLASISLGKPHDLEALVAAEPIVCVSVWRVFCKSYALA